MPSFLQKICCLASLSALMGLSGLEIASAAQKGWVRVFTDPENNYVYYIDNGTIQGKGKFRYFWMYSTSANGSSLFTVNRRPVYSVSGYFSVDCQQGVVRVRSAQLFDQNSKLIAENHAGDQGPLFFLGPQRPGGIAVSKFACSRR